MQDILDVAGKLGEAIAQSPQFKRLRDAEEKVRQNADARKHSEDFNAIAVKLARLEQERKPIEPEDKREFQRLQEAVRDDEVLQEHLAAQADYVDVMRQVNETIQKAVGFGPEQP